MACARPGSAASAGSTIRAIGRPATASRTSSASARGRIGFTDGYDLELDAIEPRLGPGRRRHDGFVVGLAPAQHKLDRSRFRRLTLPVGSTGREAGADSPALLRSSGGGGGMNESHPVRVAMTASKNKARCGNRAEWLAERWRRAQWGSEPEPTFHERLLEWASGSRLGADE